MIYSKTVDTLPPFDHHPYAKLTSFVYIHTPEKRKVASLLLPSGGASSPLPPLGIELAELQRLLETKGSVRKGFCYAGTNVHSEVESVEYPLHLLQSGR